MLGGLVAADATCPAVVAGATTSGMHEFPRVDDSNEVLALSPDGTKATFMSYDKGQNLAVFDVTSQQTTPLCFDWTPGSSWVYGAAWSLAASASLTRNARCSCRRVCPVSCARSRLLASPA